MGARAYGVAGFALLMLAACGDDTTETVAGGGGGSASCPEPERALPDGTCLSAGVPPDGCAAGFAHDGRYGCEPVLPDAACPPGSMAIPGETACHLVMACGAG